jgi:WD40-like Beta Propeller Repeat
MVGWSSHRRMQRGRFAVGIVAVVTAAVVGTQNASAKFSGVEGHWLAFERVVGGSSHIFLAKAGGPAFALTQGASIDGRPAWDMPPDDADCAQPSQIPTHHRLAFDSRAPGGRADIFVVDVGGLETTAPPAARAAPTNITSSPGANETAPSWLPFGFVPPGGPPALGLLAFARDGDIFVADETGGNLVDVTPEPADDVNPDWSPDGRYLAFESTRSGTRQIWATPITFPGGHPTAGTPYQITHGADPKHDPTWLGHSPPFSDPTGPADLQIVYSVEQGGRSYLDSIVQDITDDTADPFTPAAGPPPTIQELTGDPGDDRAPSWSSGAHAVVYSTTGGGTTSSLRILRGSTTEPLTVQPSPAVVPGGDDTNPDWQPFFNCADPHPQMPAPAPVTRTAKPPSGGSNGGSGSSTTTQPSKVLLRARILRLNSRGHGRRRMILVRLEVNVNSVVRARLARNRRQLASKRWRISSGSHLLRFRVPRRARPGVYVVRLTVNGNGQTTRVAQRVRLRR